MLRLLLLLLVTAVVLTQLVETRPLLPVRRGTASSVKAGLMNLFGATGGENWKDKTGWGGNGSYCDWRGVRCNAAGDLTYITLSSNSARGTLPHDWSGLSTLTKLYCTQNSLSGTIPDGLLSLTSLTDVSLRKNNGLSGTLKPHFSQLQTLEYIALSQNCFSGTVSPSPTVPQQSHVMSDARRCPPSGLN